MEVAGYDAGTARPAPPSPTMRSRDFVIIYVEHARAAERTCSCVGKAMSGAYARPCVQPKKSEAILTRSRRWRPCEPVINAP